ncbi:sporulation-specific protein 15-like isoform X2 [Etheostoma cragini]|uniref:sporulation-specific protein 15-like isoform X2 n=1 Tax=Etheostoma cragini TaxID=417921 RepID=UPI00155ECD3C|nr:sporulation-specific protein 15-like isoform X2 [Etheostoma cragini]
MDLSADSGTLPTHTTLGGPVLEQELSLPNARCQAESGGTILLQLLEFKTHLLEAVEELHIRRDAETRFEDQINKLALEKQELDWEKESLQHQIETVANQHTESLINVKEQLQAKIRNIEEEKGKYQVSAELKDKEINNLKEELKTLQLLKYNLEKKSSELEQKLALQNRSKDSHLNQLGEVEKRFSALSRQCAMVKHAHEKLEQNVDEAMKINKKLTTANEKQEANIVSLKKELEEVSNKLIKAKMSSVRHDKAHSPTGREQHFQQLQQKLNMETEMNKKLRDENIAVRAEKQEVMKSLQHTQQLLLSQTQTVSRLELELQTQREQYQALKQEHHTVMREKKKAMEEKMAQLMENYAASKNRWDNEKSVFLDCIKSEQQDLQAVKEAYNKLHQGHTELSSQTKVQAQHIHELEMRDSSQSLSVSTKIFPNLVEKIREEETLNEPISSSKLPGFGSLQPLASSVTKNPDCLEDTGAVTKLVAIKVTGESTVSSLGYMSIDGSVDLLSKEKRDEGNGEMSEKEQGWKDDVKQVQNNREDGERIEEQQWNKEKVKGENVKEGGRAGEMGVSAGEKRGTLMAQTTDRADRQDCSQGSTEDAGEPKQPETEKKHRAEGEGTYGAEEKGKTGQHTAETQIPAQTTTDMTTKKSNTQQVIDFMDTEPLLAACEPSDCSQNLFQKIREKDADSSHVKKGNEVRREIHTFCSDEHQSVNLGPNFVIQEVQPLCHDEDQTFAKSVSQLPSLAHQVSEKTKEEKPSYKSAAKIPTEPSGPLNQSSICSSQTVSALLAAQSDGSDIMSDMKQPDKMCDNEECVLLTTVVESQAFLQSQITDNDDKGYSSACKKESQSNVKTCEINSCETGQELMEKSNLKDAWTDITMDTVNLESWVETGSYQEHMENDKKEDTGDAKTTQSETVLKLSVHPSHESNASPETGSKKYYEQSPANKLLLDDTIELSPPSNKCYRSSFDLGSAQRKTGSPMSEQHKSGSGGLLRHPASTIPMFLKSMHNKVPLVISGASDLLNASSVCGTAASIRRQQGEWKCLGKTFRETAKADMESSASVSITSFPVSTSITVSRLSWPTTPGCSSDPTSTVGPGSESDWEPSGSQEREDEQSSFRAHISTIEQFLNTERLRLPKRRKTEN